MLHSRHFVHRRLKECYLAFRFKKQHFGIILIGTSFLVFDIHSTIIDADGLFILPLSVSI
jgi:hypothetical protein